MLLSQVHHLPFSTHDLLISIHCSLSFLQKLSSRSNRQHLWAHLTNLFIRQFHRYDTSSESRPSLSPQDVFLIPCHSLVYIWQYCSKIWYTVVHVATVEVTWSCNGPVKVIKWPQTLEPLLAYTLPSLCPGLSTQVNTESLSTLSMCSINITDFCWSMSHDWIIERWSALHFCVFTFRSQVTHDRNCTMMKVITCKYSGS